MRVISKSRLIEFWRLPGNQEAAGPSAAWFQHVNNKSVAWRNWVDLKRDFPSASAVGNCTVFNIGGNKYRLVTRVLYVSHKVFILKVMRHSEYDDDTWKEDCGCYEPPPKRRPPLRRKQN